MTGPPPPNYRWFRISWMLLNFLVPAALIAVAVLHGRDSINSAVEWWHEWFKDTFNYWRAVAGRLI
ncbi:hypothetical protein HJ590_14205 [Naumannella sp. ID2617S]|nr:hypothetical protein [Naumannella sp. ID2617S]